MGVGVGVSVGVVVMVAVAVSISYPIAIAYSHTYHIPAGSVLWCFAESYNGDGFEALIRIQNQNAATATISVTYMLQGGSTISRQHSIDPLSRYTIFTHDPAEVGLDQAFSTKVTSNLPIIAERATYFANGGYNTIGVTSPATTRYLAEGYTGDGFTTFILLENPNDTIASLDITYMLQGGDTFARQHTINPHARYSVIPQDPEEVGLGQAFCTKVLANGPIIVERSVCFSQEGHNTIGMAQVAPQDQ